VVPVTGVTRNNYDVKKELPAWREAMLTALARISGLVSKGEIPGLVIGRAGVPNDDGHPTGWLDLAGLFANDFDRAAQMADFIGNIARKKAEKRPSRAIV